jgi:AraC-like DNA-binding protein
MFAHMPIIRDILYGAASRGASLSELCKTLKLRPEELGDSEIKLDFHRAIKAWEYATQMTNDNLLGLHIGESSTASIMGMVGNLMQSCPDLLSAFENMTRYSSLATDMFDYSTKSSSNEVTLSYSPAGLWIKTSPRSARHAVEQAMSGTLQVFQHLAGARIFPLRTIFKHKRAGDLSEYNRVFHSDVQFGSVSNQLVFQKKDMRIRVVSHDRALFAVFEKMLKEKKPGKTLGAQVRQLILSDFQGQIPSLEIISARLNTTSRTLQRRLSNEGVTFRSLVVEIQRELTNLLMKSGARVSQVTDYLGYSDSSAFRRAYKKWHPEKKA